jgi:hypothetical protein
MDQKPFIIPMLVNKVCFARTMPNTSYLLYSLIDSRFARKYNLERIRIDSCTMMGFNEQDGEIVDEVAVIQLDINGYKE